MDKIPSTDQSSDKLHILDYWRIIRVRFVTILLVFLLTAVTTTVVTLFLPKTYMSLSRISIEKDTSDIAPLLGMQSGPTAFDPYFIQTEFEKIQSQKVLDKVVAKCNLTEDWKRLNGGNLLSTIEARKILKKAIDIRQFRNTSIIELRAYDRIPRKAQEIAQALAMVYQNHRKDAQTARVKEGIKALEGRKDETDKQILVMQANVDKLRTDLNISDAAGEDSYSIIEPEIVRRYESELIDVKGIHTTMSTLLDGLKALSAEELRASILTAHPDPQLDVLIRELHTGQQTLANLSIDLGEEHPRIKGLKKVVATLEEQIDNRIQGILAGLGLRVNSSQAQVEQLKRDVNAAKQRESAMRKTGREYFDAKRELSNTTRIRDTILFRIMQEEVDLALPKESTVEITDDADRPLKAIRPNVPLNITLGVVVGLILGVGLAFFIEYLDTSVKTIDDVERALGAAGGAGSVDHRRAGRLHRVVDARLARQPGVPIVRAGRIRRRDVGTVSPFDFRRGFHHQHGDPRRQHRGHLRQQIAVYQQRLGLAVVENVTGFVRGRVPVHRHRVGAHQQRALGGFEKGHVVAQKQRHAVAFADAQAAKPAGRPFTVFADLIEANHPLASDQTRRAAHAGTPNAWRACSYSRARRATSSPAGRTSSTTPMPWPQPQMSFQALDLLLPPEPKLIFEGSLSGRLAGSMPALMIDGAR